MAFAGKNIKDTITLKVDKAVYIVDAAAPETTELSFEGFGLADAFKAAALHISKERIDPALVSFCPETANTDIRPRRDLPTAIASVYLDQIVFGEVRFAGINILRHLRKIAKIAF